MKKESILPFVFSGIVIALLAAGGIWYSVVHQDVIDNKNIQEVSTTTPAPENIATSSLPFLPIESDINETASDTRWIAGQSVKIKWMATVPWNASGNDPNVDQGSFAIELVGPDGSSLTVASGSAKTFMTTEGDVYSHFEAGYTVPKNQASGTYSIVIDQYLKGYKNVGQWPVTISPR